MFQFDLKQNVLFREFETQIVVLEAEQNELCEIQEKPSAQPVKKKKFKVAQKSDRSRADRELSNAAARLCDIAIEPFSPSHLAPSVSPLPAPLHTHIRVEEDHVETWSNEVDGAAEYELWVGPLAFDIPEQPARCLYRGCDRAFTFPLADIFQPGFYHFRARAVDMSGRPGAWSSEKSLPFHVPVLELEVTPGTYSGTLSIHWEPVESASHYELQIDQRVVCSSDVPSKCLQNLPLGMHEFKVRPIFSGGATEWEALPAARIRLEPPLEITPQELNILGKRDSYTLHWCCPADAVLDRFVILDPDHDQRVLGQVIFQANEKSWLESFYKSRKAYRWPIPPALQVEGQRFAVQAVKGKVTGPLSEIKPFPLTKKSIPPKVIKNETECSVVDLDLTLREFLRKKQVYGKLTEQKLEMYDNPSQLRQYSVYHYPVLQAMNLQPRTDYRLSLTLNNGQLWQVEIIFNPKTYKYNLTFQGIPGG